MIVAKPQVVVFTTRRNGHRYVLIEILKKGRDAQTAIVRSLQDGKVYVRKYYCQGIQSRRANREAQQSRTDLLTGIAPKVINFDFVRTDRQPDLYVYEYCNGGDLQEFCEKVIKKENRYPEALVWNICSQVVALIAFIHTGWETTGNVCEMKKLTHGDINIGNLFLDWDSVLAPHPFPRLLLGDWTRGVRESDPDWDIKETEGSDKTSMRRILTKLFAAEADGECMKLFNRLFDEGEAWKLEPANRRESIVKYVAERFVPAATAKIEELEAQAQEKLEFTYTRPAIPSKYKVYTGRPDTLLVKPWEYMDEDKLPAIVRQ